MYFPVHPLWFSVSLCLCGEINKENIHHRDTEVTQRTAEITRRIFFRPI